MRTNIKATGIELTGALSDYVMSKMGMLDKLTANFGDVLASVEIGKETNHHKTGNWFFAEANLKCDGKMLRHVAEETDLYAAIDKMKDGLAEELRTFEKRKNTLFRRGSRALKNLFARSWPV